MNQFVLNTESLRRRNFTPEEFLRSVKADNSLKDNDPANDIKNEPNAAQLSCGMKLADKMQELRDLIKLPIHVTSGFRSPALNKAVKGDPSSKHLQFLACDFNIEGKTPNQAVRLIKDSGFSVDKCFVERGCVHAQFAMLDQNNRNYFGRADLVNGEWVVTKLD
jgi:zinc D-Ala-D-Ala carboxypeptidase